jgi:hypothetical protein
MMPPPITPTIIGSTTVSASRLATAASIALPPRAKISAPAAEASGWLVTTILAPQAGRLSHSNDTVACARQFDVIAVFAPGSVSLGAANANSPASCAKAVFSKIDLTVRSIRN